MFQHVTDNTDELKSKSVEGSHDKLDSLSDSELRALADWGKSEEYMILKKLLKSNKDHHASMLLHNAENSTSKWDMYKQLFIRVGAYREGANILRLPDRAEGKLNKKKQDAKKTKA